ncbi:NAD(P)/FAD-dependent oxidoreductase [Novosphingobium sp.]|uniref:NAD(P)/FAD-dependent oxidoreductase n=1 Tax=Novosphingobium sp. TaxID=1874826 RepID=UPI001D89B3BD|nr:NAD(P)/FAD-dependent oxidoreductase [Novosphingobium sp.]MBX9664121.1 NAD(P)/FAD-dependent oxidoreductase [Novosphingobium sp.]
MVDEAGDNAAALAGRRPHVVIVGGGFGGLAAAKALAGAPVDVTLIDKRNHHLFQPLLYQVATAGLSPADIAGSIRAILARQKNVRVLLDRVYGVDQERRRVILGDGEPLAYDWLIFATGATHSYFGREDWAPYAPGVKTIDDATRIRRRVLLALERAETETDEDKRKALLTFVVIGGGPTGVEMAGAIAELARQSVSMDFRHITPHCSRILLLQKGDRLLPSFPPELSAKARKGIEELGVEVRLEADVTHIDGEGVIVDDERIFAGTTIWAAGVMASRAAEWLGCKADRAGRVPVGADLHPEGDPAVFVIGDTAACTDAAGRALPGVAPVAKQQGQHAARAIRAALQGRTVPPFRYRDYGNMATIGRSRAIADFGRLRVTGLPAWLLWCVAHIWFLTGHRNRISVGISWLWSYLTYQRGARLITGDVAPDLPATRELAPALRPKRADMPEFILAE